MTDGDPTNDAPADNSTTREIGDVTDLIRLIGELSPPKTPWFRGQRDRSWDLTPHIRRLNDPRNAEKDMLDRFRQEAAATVAYTSMSEWDWLCMAQHHGLPTRLLDWSTNPLVALYFASETKKGDESDGRLFRLDPAQLNRKTFSTQGVLLLGENTSLDDFLPSRIDSRLGGQVAVVAHKSFARIQAQSGCFTLRHPSDTQDLSAQAAECLTSWVVPLVKKEQIRQQLRTLGIDEGTVYTDLDARARRIKEDYL